MGVLIRLALAVAALFASRSKEADFDMLASMAALLLVAVVLAVVAPFGRQRR